MKQKQTRNADKARGRFGNRGFTIWDLLILIAGIVILALFIVNFHGRILERPGHPARCLSNINGLWKAASSWGLDPVQTWRPAFPETNLAYALALDNAGITPEIFICPDAARRKSMSGISIAGKELTQDVYIPGKNREWGIYAAPNLASVRESNCNYAYFGGRSFEDGKLILIADKNGSNNLPSATAWGGNHDGKGGNVIKVAGQGFWVATPLPSRDAIYCITNSDIAAAFATTGTVYAY